MIGSPSAGKSLVGEIVSIDDLCYREVFFHQLLRQLVRRRDDSGVITMYLRSIFAMPSPQSPVVSIVTVPVSFSLTDGPDQMLFMCCSDGVIRSVLVLVISSFKGTDIL